MSKIDKNRFAVKSRSSALMTGRSDDFDMDPGEIVPGVDFSQMDSAEKLSMLRQILQDKIHGISFSPYFDGQRPGIEISEDQIRQRLQIIQPYTRSIRTFSCTEGNEDTPRIAKESGLQTMVGIGISEEPDKNEIEIANGIEIARQGHADILAVGNEVLLRGDVSEQALIDYIERVKSEVGDDVQVGYVDAYFLFENHPALVEACDVLLINCYPFWECCEAPYALAHMQQMYARAEQVSSGKKVIISETGWPSIGSPYGEAVPSVDNAIEYFIDTFTWANEAGIEVFYFSSFDENWKVGAEGDVGAHWGLWDAEGNFKYD